MTYMTIGEFAGRVRLSPKALARWATEHDRQPIGALRQVLIADWRTATPDTLACDLTIPVRSHAQAAARA